MNKGTSVREQDKQHISRKFRVNTILTTSRKEKKFETYKEFLNFVHSVIRKCVMIYANITGKKCLNYENDFVSCFHCGSLANRNLSSHCRLSLHCQGRYTFSSNEYKQDWKFGFKYKFQSQREKKPTTIRIK